MKSVKVTSGPFHSRGGVTIEALPPVGLRWPNSGILPATSMCSTLEWDTLEQRRRLRDVTLFYKIKHGLEGIALPYVLIPINSRTRCQNTNKLQVVTSSCLTYQYSYFVLCVPVWNHLPQSAIDARTIAQFQTAAFPTIRAL